MDDKDLHEEFQQMIRKELKTDRKEFTIIGGKNLEIIREELPPEIHGALDFTEDRAYIGVPIQVEMKKEDRTFLIWKTGIITSERELIMLDYDMINKGTDFMRIGQVPKDLKSRWERASFFDYLEGVEDINGFDDVFDMIRYQLVYYMDLMDEREYDLIAAWIMMTYFFPMFKTLPILYLNAVSRAGKTKLLMLMAAMGFSDGSISPNISTSAFFRSIETSRTACFIDENERIGRKEKNELKELLNACYKKGAVVKRSQETLDMRGIKGFQVREFNVFAPLALASIYNIDDVLESRCIRITLQRTLLKKGNTEVDMDSFTFQNIRNALYTLTLKYWKTIKNIYDEDDEEDESIYIPPAESLNDNQLLYNNTDNSNVNLSSNLPTPILSSFASSSSSLSNREKEMWKPIFTIAKVTGNKEILRRLYALALEKSEAFKMDNISEETNSIVLDGLLRTVIKEDWYTLSDLVQGIQTYHEMADWLKPKILSSVLKTIGLDTSKKRVRSGRVSVFLSPEMVQKAAGKIGIDVEAVLKEQGFETATNQVEKLDIIIGTEEKLKSAVISEATAAGITNVESKVQTLINQGILFEPKIGFIKKAGG